MIKSKISPKTIKSSIIRMSLFQKCDCNAVCFYYYNLSTNVHKYRCRNTKCDYKKTIIVDAQVSEHQEKQQPQQPKDVKWKKSYEYDLLDYVEMFKVNPLVSIFQTIEDKSGIQYDPTKVTMDEYLEKIISNCQK